MKKLVALLLCLMMVVPATLASAETAEGKVLNIWCWNDEFQSRFNAYYPEVKEIAEDKSTTTLNDGTIVKWTINPNEGNNYQNKLDEALRAQESAAADDKIDIFLIEADYALKYVDSPYTLDVKADIGLTDEDLAGQYKYTQEIATSADGKLKAVTWQATPGLFAYRRSIAKDVLGTDDPDAVQEALADWDKFNAVAEQAAAKGYYMLSGYDDAYRTFSNNVSAPWVADDGETVVVDANLMKWVDQTKLYTDKGYNHKSSLWDATWAADQGPTGKVFGFFYSTWGINFTLLGNSLETSVANGGKEEVGNGAYGDYAPGPAGLLLGRHLDLRGCRHRQRGDHQGRYAEADLRRGDRQEDYRGHAGLHQQRGGYERAGAELLLCLPRRPEPHRAVRGSGSEDRHEQHLCL